MRRNCSGGIDMEEDAAAFFANLEGNNNSNILAEDSAATFFAALEEPAGEKAVKNEYSVDA